MKNLFKIASIIGLTVITQTAYSGEVTATFTTGDILTAEKLKNIKSAVNDNDTRISNIALTPGPAGAAGTNGIAGADGANGEDGAAGPTGTPCTVAQGQGSATITCGGGNTMASVYGMTTSAEQGDMQYYDGSAWVVVNSPTDTDVVNTLRFVDGKPSWAPTYYEIGDRGPAGGFVFYVTHGGLHGLEAAPSDQSDGIEWGCYSEDVTGAEGRDVGTGASNTDAILALNCSNGSPAARVAAEYETRGFVDWYLPSHVELELMVDAFISDVSYEPGAPPNLYGVDVSADGLYYWTSTWALARWANGCRFRGACGSFQTNSILRVRAVRNF
jgi:hypothetical protein